MRGKANFDQEGKVKEVAALIVQHSWTLEAACRLVCIEATEAVRYAAENLAKRPHLLPVTPTPAEIAAQCREIRELVPRPLVGFGRLPPISVMRCHLSPEGELVQELG